MHYLNKNVVLTGLLVSLDYESDTIAKFSMAVSTINSVVCEAYLFFYYCHKIRLQFYFILNVHYISGRQRVFLCISLSSDSGSLANMLQSST